MGLKPVELIGWYFFRNEAVNIVTLDDKKLLWTRLERIDLENVWSYEPRSKLNNLFLLWQNFGYSVI